MFIEYPFSMNEEKAEIRLNTVIHNVKPDKSMIYIEREQSGYTAVVKLKAGRRIYEKQKWLITRTSKGLKVKRAWSNAYLADILCITVFGLACLAALIFSLIKTDNRMEPILLGLVFLLLLMFYIWKRIATPGISLKVFLIKIL